MFFVSENQNTIKVVTSISLFFCLHDKPLISTQNNSQREILLKQICKMDVWQIVHIFKIKERYCSNYYYILDLLEKKGFFSESIE